MELSNIEDLKPAQNTSKRNISMSVPIVTIEGTEYWYEMITTPCACPDRTFYHGHLAGKRNHFFTVCKAHGLQDCGVAVRASRLTSADDPDRQNRRRTSGYTTHAWYQARGK